MLFSMGGKGWVPTVLDAEVLIVKIKVQQRCPVSDCLSSWVR